MRIGFVSTYPPAECGIATYTHYLRQALDPARHESFVICQSGGAGEGVFPLWHPGQRFSENVFGTATRMTPDVMHIQHEYGLFGSQYGAEVVDLLLRLRLAEVPTVVTLHTVYESITDAQRMVLRHIVEDASAIVVHEAYQKETLVREFGRPEKVHVIEHGIREVDPVPDAKRRLGLEGKKVVLMCGYFRKTKGFDEALRFFPEVAEQCDDAVLVMAGKIRGIEAKDVQAELYAALDEMPFADRVRYFRGQFPQYTLDALLSAADCVVLPYRAGAQSGMLSQCLAFGAPVVSSGLRAFRDVLERTGGGLVCDHPEEYASAITRVLTEPDLADDLRRSARQYIRRTGGWSRIAERHLDVYEPLVNPPGSRGQYAFIPEPGSVSGDSRETGRPGRLPGADRRPDRGAFRYRDGHTALAAAQ
ncbi:glycosyltransferase [Alienimonas sp. DA493]|uniref:glycosyltransferase n=1 Tax=Alienimonas sp. DA493 TaxID=3373605 RepID=UPI003754B0EF